MEMKSSAQSFPYAPNDIVVKSDDSIWFTDPLFGINGEWEVCGGARGGLSA